MNKTMLASMREQMCPSEAAQAALWARLAAEPIPKKKETRYVKSWKSLALAACAACAALVLGAYPMYRAINPPLHSYTVLEGGGMTTLDGAKAPAGGKSDPSAIPGGAYVSGDKGKPDIDGNEYAAPGQDISVDEAAADQYDRLLRGMGMHGEGAASYPDWFAGAWIDQSQLTVAIVDGLRTPELEAEITGWCGDGVVFRDAKYSHAYLDGLMDQAVTLLDGTELNCGVGVDVAANCLGVDIYSDGDSIPEDVLATLAQLDPDGDAIRVQALTDKLRDLPEDEIKGFAIEPYYDGGASDLPDKLPGKVESAHYDLLPREEK